MSACTFMCMTCTDGPGLLYIASLGTYEYDIAILDCFWCTSKPRHITETALVWTINKAAINNFGTFGLYYNPH